MTRMPLFRAACLTVSLLIAPWAQADKSAANAPKPAADTSADVAARPSFAEPNLSPDGLEIAFVQAGDIWTVPSAGGVAHLLVAHPASESRPLFSPDGKKIAFVSTRTGNGDIYVLTFATGDVSRLTFDDGVEQLDAWSADGQYIYFSTSVNDLGAGNADVYRVRAAGGTPMPVSDELYVNEAQAAPSPDGKALAVVAGASTRDWWRAGHSNWNETHVWIRRQRKNKPDAFEELTPIGTREMWPMWSPDAKTLYCVGDPRSEASSAAPQNIVSYDLTAKGPKNAKPLTSFKDGRVLWPSMSGDGRSIVFERNFGIWKVATAGGSPQEVPITLRGAAASSAETVTPVNFTGGFHSLALSPDGKKIAFVVHGEVFAASAREGGRAVRVTDTPAVEGQVDWSPDSRRIVYVSARGGAQNLYLYDFSSQSETPLTYTDGVDSTPKFSPDGKTIAYRHNGVQLRLIDVATRKSRLLVDKLAAAFPPFDDGPGPFAFSPKGQWVAYIDTGKRGFDNVFVVNTRLPRDGDAPAEPQQVTFFANTGSNAVSWSGDGRSLLFGTGMRTEDFQLARVDLVPRPPNFAEDQFRGLFDDGIRTIRPGGPRSPVRPEIDRVPAEPPATPKSPANPKEPTGPTTVPADDSDLPATTKPATAPSTTGPGAASTQSSKTASRGPAEEYDLTDIRQRVSLLSVGADVDQQVVSPDGKWCVFIGGAGGRQNLYAYPLDAAATGEPAFVRQVTLTGGGKASPRFAPDSREVYYLENGQIRAVNIDTRTVREIAVTAPMEVDFAQEKVEVARQAWTYLKLNFYDPRMHGVDWNAVRDRITPQIAGAKTGDELRRILSLMAGELNASHMGVNSPSRFSLNVGRLGLAFDRAVYEKDGVFKVTHVLPQSPAQQAGIEVGEAILAIDGVPMNGSTNLAQQLDRKINRRVVLKVGSGPKFQTERQVPLRPTDLGTQRTLIYREWVEKNRTYVDKISKGRLGYVHIADMSDNALARLNQDLDAQSVNRDGVVVDVRANTGGFVSPYVLDVLSRRGYLTIGRRGAADAPGRAFVGQRALDLPTILVTNHQSISDAENFTEGYRALKLGKVVGEPTAGGVIFTSDVALLDGTSFRIPFSKVTAANGQSLEGAGRPVDVLARRKLGETAAGKDTQLDVAVRELTRQLDKPKAPAKAKPAEKAAP